MWWVGLWKPSAEPRRCSRRPLSALVGPLLVPGWSKKTKICAAAIRGSSEGSDLDQAGRDSMGEFGVQGLHPGLARGGVGLVVGGDHLLVDVPGGLDLDMVIAGEQRVLDAAPALVQGVSGKADDVERVRHRCRGREFLAGGGLGPGEPVHRDHLHPIAPRLGALRHPRLERGSAARLVS